jgi:hypothetical protein
MHDILEDSVCGRGLEAGPSGVGVALVARSGEMFRMIISVMNCCL